MIISKNEKEYFQSRNGNYLRPMESYQRKNTNRMFVNGKYIPKSHALHTPGTFKSWDDVPRPSTEALLENIETEDGYLYDFADFVQAKRTKGFVYVITNPAWPGWVKVGHSRNPMRRLDNYQTGCPDRNYELQGYVYFSDRVAAEAEIHNLLEAVADERRGEWFYLDSGVAMDYVKEVAEDME